MDRRIRAIAADAAIQITAVETTGPETWNKPLVMPIIERIEIIP